MSAQIQLKPVKTVEIEPGKCRTAHVGGPENAAGRAVVGAAGVDDLRVRERRGRVRKRPRLPLVGLVLQMRQPSQEHVNVQSNHILGVHLVRG